nr:hypothetical protein [Tanacetum cinerariifolium]
MMEYYSDRCDKIKNDVKNGHYANDGGVDCMEEVGIDTSGSATFLAQNEVVNGMSNTTKQDELKWLISDEKINMCASIETQLSKKLVNRVGDYFLIIGLGFLIRLIAMEVVGLWKHLWRNLLEHCLVVNNEPWVVLGDFNVTFNVKECSNSFGVIDEDMDVFRKVLYLDSKAFNGNVFDKVKALRVELKRVQTSLDKELDCVHLREEEFVYCNAYKEAVSDEKKVLRQKTKIQWLKEGDQNSTHFHNMMKGRINKSRIEAVYDDQGIKYEGDDIASNFVDHFQKFLGAEDDVFPIDGLDRLFTKKLDSQCADLMVRPILDEEIKYTMFYIEDDKAAGPDGQFNANLILLVPELPTPLKITDYRPIACCNVVYKCISKVIVNRLKEGLGSILECNQSAFIPGRQISDNILLAQEFMNGYGCRGGAQRCAFKVDIEKAYDTVNWDFLKTALQWFGFHATVINWIMGLRQGDPMSPNLFTVVMEVFNLMVQRHISLDVRFKALDEFSMSSGLYPSMAKSTVFYGNVPDSVKDNVNLAMPFREGVLPVRYSGVPLTAKKLSIADCRVLTEKVKKRVLEWHNKSILFGRKLILAKVASVAWKDVCKPKEQDGLGLKSLRVMNHALMVKHLWNIASKKDSLWVKWLNAYRIKGKCLWEVKLKKNFYWSLKQILELRNSIKGFVGYKIGNGNDCFIWFNEVINVSVPVIDHECVDKALWFNKKNEEVQFSVKEAWKVLRVDDPKVILKTQDRISLWFDADDMVCPFCKSCKDSHSHLFFQCGFVQSVWMRLKPMSRLEDLSCVWAEIISGLNIKRYVDSDKAAAIWRLPIKDVGKEWDSRGTFGSSSNIGIIDTSIGTTSSFFGPYVCDHPMVEVIRECQVDFSYVKVMMHRFGSHKGGGKFGNGLSELWYTHTPWRIHGLFRVHWLVFSIFWKAMLPKQFLWSDLVSYVFYGK